MPTKRLRIGLAIDATMDYGRGIMRGVMRYANVRRRWLLHEEFHAAINIESWPKCDGAIVTTSYPAVLGAIQANSRKIVNTSETADPADAPIVCIDGEAAGRMAAQHLIDCRLRNFGYYGKHSPAADTRLKGFASRLHDGGMACSIAPVQYLWITRADWADRPHWPALIAWLRQLPKPVGIMGWDDLTARDLAAACLEAQIPVPDHVAIIGVNNDDLLCDSAFPPLSSVDVDFSQVGYLAARQLEKLLDGQTLPPEERLIRVAPQRVVKRVSTSLLAVDDVDLAQAVAFIREHACEPCAVSDVLEHVPVNRRWLERRFLEQLGRSPHDEIIRVRMDMAQQLLRESEEPLPQIAARCGFMVPQTFAHAFQRSYGVTPAAYRRSHRHAEKRA